MEVIRAAELLVDKIKRDYADDISLLVVMGSYVFGETHAQSDLDLYFVPKTERGYNLAFTFILDGIGFDFWAISWERLERIAAHEERITSIVTDGQVLYCATEEDGRRFQRLRDTALAVGDRTARASRAQRKLQEAWPFLVHMSLKDNLVDVRSSAIGVLYAVTGGLAALNGTTIKRGRGRLKGEVLAMPLAPRDFAERYDVIFLSDDAERIYAACRDLTLEVEALINRERTASSEPASFAYHLDGWYEESINFYNKVYHACETGDAVTALFAGVELEHEIEEVLADTEVGASPMPNLVDSYDPNHLDRYMEAAREHQRRLEEFLQSRGVQFRVFADWEALKAYLDTL